MSVDYVPKNHSRARTAINAMLVMAMTLCFCTFLYAYAELFWVALGPRIAPGVWQNATLTHGFITVFVSAFIGLTLHTVRLTYFAPNRPPPE